MSIEIAQGETIEVSADFSNPSSPIRWREKGAEKWRGTCYQVADARHYPDNALAMVEEWLEMQGGA